MKQLTQYWQSLSTKEQKLLSVAGAIFIVFLFVMVVWRPLNLALEKTQKDLLKQQELSIWLTTSLAKIKTNEPKGSSSTNLSTLVNSSRNRYNINITRMVPKDNTLRVTIDSVEFNKLVDWLAELTSTHGVVITNVELNKHDTQGFVKVSRLEIEK